MYLFYHEMKICLAVLLAIVLGAAITSCRHSARCCHGDDAHYAQVDSLLNGINEVDSLAAMVEHYHNEGDAIGEMVALRYQGRALRQHARFNEAVELHTRSLDIATAAADTLEMMTVLNSIATDYRQAGDLSKAYIYNYKALLLSDAYSDHDSPDAVKQRLSLLTSIGNIEVGLHHYAKADSVLRVALRGEQSMGNYSGMAVNYAHLGSVKRAQGDRDSAMIFYRESLKYNQLAGSEIGAAMCHVHFGELYVDERQYSRAQYEFEQAYDQLKRVDYIYYWMKACLSLANVNLLLGEKEKALQYIQEAEAEALHVNSFEYQADVYQLYYELAKQSGDQQRALEYFVKSVELKDSVSGPDKSEKMERQLDEYHANLKQGEMSSLNKDIERLHRTRRMMGLFTALFLLMAGAIITALVYASRVRSRTERLLRQVEETRSLFFTNVVHQLRTPLTAIMGALDGIVADADKNSGNSYTDRQLENFRIIGRQGNHLLLMVDRILEVGGVRSDIRGPEWRTGDVVGYLRMIVESYREQCINQQIELTYVSAEKEVNMDVVPNYLNTIVGNLIENAISYSNDFCKISVTSQVKGKNLIINVADNGIGIGEVDVPHVFEPFYRAAIAEQMCEGIGIGLTVVRDMATVLGGSVAVESVPGSGSVFTVTLPLSNERNEVHEKLEMVVKPVKELVRKRHNAPVDDAAQGSKKGRANVLVVEDHNDVARLIGAALGKGFNVHYASNGEQGLSMAIRLLPDLIITDVKMPVMDGLELCRRVRASNLLRHIPIIVLSARTSERDRIRGIEAGADAYMIKPFAADELNAWSTKLVETRKILKEVYSNTQSVFDIPALESGSQQDDETFLAAFAQLVDKASLKGAVRLNLGEIAVQLKMGESQLRRRIQVLTGKNANNYITQLRMEKALKLLKEHPTMLIGDIAEQCGFSDVAYFSRVFRQHYKMTPTEARKNKNG